MAGRQIPMGLLDNSLEANPDTYQPRAEGGVLSVPVPKEMRGQYGNFFLTNRPENKPMLENAMNVNPEYTAQIKPSAPAVPMSKENQRAGFIQFSVSKGKDPMQAAKYWDTINPEPGKYSPEALDFEKKKAEIKPKGLEFGDKELIKKTMTEMPKLRREAMNSNDSLKTIITMDRLVESGVTGKGGQFKGFIAPYAEMVGYKGEDLSEAQAFGMLGRLLTGPLRQELVGTGPVSDAEQALWDKLSGGKGASKGAVKELLNHYRRKLNSNVSVYNDTLEGFSSVYPNVQSVYKPIVSDEAGVQEGTNNDPLEAEMRRRGLLK